MYLQNRSMGGEGMNAFIIGNGFDLAHKMPTSYNCFYNYLINRFPNINHSFMHVPTPMTAPDGGDVVDETDATSLLCHLINDVCGDDWSNFETALGEIDLLQCFGDLKEVYDKDGDRNLWHEAYNNEDRASDLCCVIPMIKDLFSDWIETIAAPKDKLKGFSDLIDPNTDLFITFNYTHTLEELYGCKNVIHMHGEVGNEIIIGHNGNLDYSEDNLSVPIGCFNSLQEIYEGLRKNTFNVIEKHYNELASISNCSQIYSFGFSYSSIDLPYIGMICQLIKNKDVKWLNNDYDGESRINDYKMKIINSGFKGEFLVYNV